MKTMKVVALMLFFSMTVMVSQSFAQKVGTAADKQKQENLEKNKARQAELKKKYNSLTPEQAAQARKRANEYKAAGGKKIPAGAGSKIGKESGKTSVPVTGNKNTGQAVKGTPQKPAPASKPILMDEKGKPLNAAKPAATQPVKTETNTRTTEVKKTTTSAAPATPAVPAKTPATPAVPAEKKKIEVKVK